MTANFSALRPLGNTILFQFLDSTGGQAGRFQERTKGNIYIPVVKTGQTSDDRWGRIVAMGPDVKDLRLGEFILVKAGKWTMNEVWEGEKVWKTIDDPDVLLLATDDEESTVRF